VFDSSQYFIIQWHDLAFQSLLHNDNSLGIQGRNRNHWLRKPLMEQMIKGFISFLQVKFLQEYLSMLSPIFSVLLLHNLKGFCGKTKHSHCRWEAQRNSDGYFTIWHIKLIEGLMLGEKCAVFSKTIASCFPSDMAKLLFSSEFFLAAESGLGGCF